MPIPDLRRLQEAIDARLGEWGDRALDYALPSRPMNNKEIYLNRDIIRAGALDPKQIRVRQMGPALDEIAGFLNIGAMSWGDRDILMPTGDSPREIMRHEMTHLAQNNKQLPYKALPWYEGFIPYNREYKYLLPETPVRNASDLYSEQQAMALEAGYPNPNWSMDKEPELAALVRNALLAAPAKNNKADAEYRQWYAGVANKYRLDPNPDDPRHFYNYRAAYDAGVRGPDASGHWPSKYKLEGHPNLVINGIDTRTGQLVRTKR
jgi:hypothetical protein